MRFVRTLLASTVAGVALVVAVSLGAPTPALANACGSSAYNLSPFKWSPDTFPYSRNGSERYAIDGPSIPDEGVLGGSRIQGRDAIKFGHDAWTFTRNRCGFSNQDNFALVSNFSDRQLVVGDGVPTRDFGPNALGCGSTALACTETLYFQNSGYIDDSDIRFNDRYGWFHKRDATTCVSRYDTEGVSAHEAGHSIGIDHAPDPDQTMYFQVDTCDSSIRRLARADVLAMRAYYP